MFYLTLDGIMDLHKIIIETSGGGHGIRDSNLLESAIAQPSMTFSEIELYPSILEKAATLCFSIIMNHPFIDGNKRTAHISMEIFLEINGYELNSISINDMEDLLLNLSSGKRTRKEFIKQIQKIGCKSKMPL